MEKDSIENSPPENNDAAARKQARLERRMRRRQTLTHAALVRRALESEGPSALIDVPISTGLFPTAGLRDQEVELLVDLLESRNKT